MTEVNFSTLQFVPNPLDRFGEDVLGQVDHVFLLESPKVRVIKFYFLKTEKNCAKILKKNTENWVVEVGPLEIPFFDVQVVVIGSEFFDIGGILNFLF